MHGGAWTGNDRLTNVDIDQALAASGVVVIAVDFRMPPAAQYPEPVADINFAIRWLRANAERFDVDPAKIGLLGTSSGGHQGLLATMRPTDSRYMAHGDAGTDDASIASADSTRAIGLIIDFVRAQTARADLDLIESFGIPLVGNM